MRLAWTKLKQSLLDQGKTEEDLMALTGDSKAKLQSEISKCLRLHPGNIMTDHDILNCLQTSDFDEYARTNLGELLESVFGEGNIRIGHPMSINNQIYTIYTGIA